MQSDQKTPLPHEAKCKTTGDSFETILNSIRTTTTATGLQVSATQVTQSYAKGVKISDEQMA